MEIEEYRKSITDRAPESVSQKEVLNEPDVDTEAALAELISLFRKTYGDAGEYISRCRRDENVRYCKWSGQSYDQRKHAKDMMNGGQPFPFEGASDSRVYLVEIYCRFILNASISSLRRMRANAMPVSSEFYDIKRARNAADFVRWLVNIIPDFYVQAERYVNSLLTNGVGVLTTYWLREKQKTLKKIELASLEMEEKVAVLTPEQEDFAVKYLVENQEQWGLDVASEAQARKMIRELREKGETVGHHVGYKVDRGAIFSLSPTEDIFFPKNTTDAQQSPFYFQLMYYTVKDLRVKQECEGWKKEFVDYAEEHLVGVDSAGVYNNESASASQTSFNTVDKIANLVQVIHCFQKKADEYGVVGVYETVFSAGCKEHYAKDGLCDYEHGEYPIIVTKLEEVTKRLYDSRSLVELLAGGQWTYKLEVDMSNDRNSISTFPPRVRVITAQDSGTTVFAPGAEIIARRADDVQFLQPPQYNPASMEARQEILNMSDMLVGRPNATMSPAESQVRLQFFLDKFADGLGKAIDQLFKLWKQYGPAEVYFQVLGVSDSATYKKSQDDQYTFRITLDNYNQDWEVLEKQLRLMIEALPIDDSGSASRQKLLQEMFNFINPSIAERVLNGDGESSERSKKEEGDAIAKVSSGLMLDVSEADQPNMIKAQYFMEWFQSPAGQSLANNEVVGPAVQNRAQKWQFAMQQYAPGGNRDIGRQGAATSGTIG